jgi:hypothetical protein
MVAVKRTTVQNHRMSWGALCRGGRLRRTEHMHGSVVEGIPIAFPHGTAERQFCWKIGAGGSVVTRAALNQPPPRGCGSRAIQEHSVSDQQAELRMEARHSRWCGHADQG